MSRAVKRLFPRKRFRDSSIKQWTEWDNKKEESNSLIKDWSQEIKLAPQQNMRFNLTKNFIRSFQPIFALTWHGFLSVSVLLRYFPFLDPKIVTLKEGVSRFSTGLPTCFAQTTMCGLCNIYAKKVNLVPSVSPLSILSRTREDERGMKWE